MDQMLAKVQRGLVFLLLIVFPMEHSYFKWRIYALRPLVDLKCSFFPSDLIILAIFSLFFFRSKKDWLSSFWTWPTRWLILFYGAMATSLIFSEFPFTHVHSLRLLVFFTKILLFSSLVFLVREGGEKFLHRIFYVIGAFALIEALIALFCYYDQSYFDLKHICLTPFSEMTDPSSVGLPHGFRWLGDRLLGWERTPKVILRSYGTFSYPNILGGYFVFSLLVSYFLFFNAKKIWMRKAVAFFVFLQVLGLCTTYSRGALFSWIGATAIFFLLLFYFSGKEKISFPRKPAIWLIGVVACSLLVSFLLLGEQFFHRGGVFQYNEFAKSSDSARWTSQEKAFFLIRKHPFFGVGLQNFMNEEKKSVPLVHNCYLLVAAEMGLVALGCFLSFLFSLFLRIRRKAPSLEALLLLAVFVGFLTISLFDFYHLYLESGMVPFFVVAALFAGALDLQKKDSFGEEKKLLFQEIDPDV